MSIKTVLLWALLSVVLFLGVMTYFWYSYVTNTDSPYDDVGIGLNSAAPSFMSEWGCVKLKENFPKSLPPHGCS